MGSESCCFAKRALLFTYHKVIQAWNSCFRSTHFVQTTLNNWLEFPYLKHAVCIQAKSSQKLRKSLFLVFCRVQNFHCCMSLIPDCVRIISFFHRWKTPIISGHLWHRYAESLEALYFAILDQITSTENSSAHLALIHNQGLQRIGSRIMVNFEKAVTINFHVSYWQAHYKQYSIRWDLAKTVPHGQLLRPS